MGVFYATHISEITKRFVVWDYRSLPPDGLGDLVSRSIKPDDLLYHLSRVSRMVCFAVPQLRPQDRAGRCYNGFDAG